MLIVLKYSSGPILTTYINIESFGFSYLLECLNVPHISLNCDNDSDSDSEENGFLVVGGYTLEIIVGNSSL